MKLNNKGISIIEIVLTFSLIMIMVIGMLNIVFNYREKASISLEKLDMDTFKNTITKDIQDDILKYGVKEINKNGECITNLELSNCVNIVFNDGSQKAFGTSKVDNNNIASIENKFLYYDGIKYGLKDKLPEVIPEGRQATDFQIIEIQDNSILTTDSLVLEDGTIVLIYSIDVYISHFDFDEDFGVHIVTYSEKRQNNGEFEEENGDKYLVNEIMKNSIINSAPTLTTSSNNTSDASGLYKATNTNTGNPTYYFRGNVINNYVKFANQTWRIVRINEDKTIRLIMQNGINANTKYQFNSVVGNYTSMYYTNSEFKSELEGWYTNNIANNTNYAGKVVSGNYFCEQAKAKYDTTDTAGSTNMTAYGSYTPNFSCQNDKNGKGIINASVGLITYDETIYAGGYVAEVNSNYYLYNGIEFWTSSPAGFTNYNAAYSWLIYAAGHVNRNRVTNYSGTLRPVINLKPNIFVTGTGTVSDPYVIK